jgi:hypothetical protein
MTDSTQDTLKRSLAMLSSLRENIDKSEQSMIGEEYVTEFHASLETLEAIGVNVSQFRVPPSVIRPKVWGSDGRTTQYTREKYVQKPFLLTKLDAMIAYAGKYILPVEIDTLGTLERIFSRFHQVARQMRNRYDSRPTIDVSDEYDVQDLLHALLRLYFDDIRTEEWTPSYAGSSSKMDFLLKDEQVVIEVKKTREHLRDKEIGEQLIVDAAKYKTHPDCKTLVCFIYDPEGKVGNPIGLETDLGKLSGDDFNIRAFVYPK